MYSYVFVYTDIYTEAKEIYFNLSKIIKCKQTISHACVYAHADKYICSESMWKQPEYNGKFKNKAVSRKNKK